MDRIWVDEEAAQEFVANILTVFPAPISARPGSSSSSSSASTRQGTTKLKDEEEEEELDKPAAESIFRTKQAYFLDRTDCITLRHTGYCTHQPLSQPGHAKKGCGLFIRTAGSSLICAF